LLSYGGPYSSNPVPSVSGNTLTWNIPVLMYGFAFYTTVMIYCDTSAQLGDTLCVTASVATVVTDVNLANNTQTLCRPVNNSMDPNDKSVLPQGSGSTGAIANGTQLNYIINFQNMGNDAAYTVTVKDTLDTDLDMATLKIQSISHPMKPSISGRILNFRFDNINLPAMSVNEPASHGYVVYSIKPKAALPIGTQVKNTARIYFDYNGAIVTNTTLNTIAVINGVETIKANNLEAVIFPNPADGYLHIDLNRQENFSVQLFDLFGKNVKNINGINGKGFASVKDLSAGMYMVRITAADNQVLTSKLNITH
jgi:uncharacterized repeat protein (TIGR01451 family)